MPKKNKEAFVKSGFTVYHNQIDAVQLEETEDGDMIMIQGSDRIVMSYEMFLTFINEANSVWGIL